MDTLIKEKNGSSQFLVAKIVTFPCFVVMNVNFYGPQSEYVVTGSDCKHIFLWDKQTEEVVQFLQGDGVVSSMVIWMCVILADLLAILKQWQERPEKQIQAWKGIQNPDLCDAGVVLYQLSYQANWELVIISFDDKPREVRVRIMVLNWVWKRVWITYIFESLFRPKIFFFQTIHATG